MASAKLIKLVYLRFNTRKFHGNANRITSSWRGDMKRELESGNSGKQEESDRRVCIYRVPSSLRRIKPKAYTPKNISIGPYHHGAPHLRDMEDLKKRFYRRLFNNHANKAKLGEAFKFLKKEERQVRRFYNEHIKLSRNKFLKMVLVDGSFIVQLLRELSACEFEKVPRSLSPWMLPIIRYEMIMLENQLPMFVLNKLFELTSADSAPSGPNITLKDLALQFFYPLLQVDSNYIPDSKKAGKLSELHFLDLLRSSIMPNKSGKTDVERKSKPHMIRSVTELMEAGVKIKADESKNLLDISFGKNLGFSGRKLTIPPLYINDHTCTVFRNMVAFENCHQDCDRMVTAYLFFFNGLVNSAGDVSFLRYKGVLHHSLGNDNTVSQLINNITKEIVLDKQKWYLYKVVNEANEYSDTCYARVRASLVHHYFTSWVVIASTLGSLLVLYFTFIQIVFSFGKSSKAFENQSFRSVICDFGICDSRSGGRWDLWTVEVVADRSRRQWDLVVGGRSCRRWASSPFGVVAGLNQRKTIHPLPTHTPPHRPLQSCRLRLLSQRKSIHPLPTTPSSSISLPFDFSPTNRRTIYPLQTLAQFWENGNWICGFNFSGLLPNPSSVTMGGVVRKCETDFGAQLKWKLISEQSENGKLIAVVDFENGKRAIVDFENEKRAAK
ncbi:hypothetical protein V8G54_006483 [Vigna mungo]|uniref:Uncharacterized protein n=1 Tax=Vigna mungo TaxID=3915 RepID=A0AAQ3P1L9_VIGMU